jgi:hypothetical protein
MMIATTLGALVQAEPALAPICALKLSAKAAYHLKKLAQLVAQETTHFHAERDALIKDLGNPREGGGFEIAPDTDAFRDFVTQLNELAAIDVTIPWSPITLAMLGDATGLSAADLQALGPLFEEPEDQTVSV